jgi:hypothetical protein
MHSWTARINAIFAFSTFIFLGLLAINILSTRWLTPSPSSFENSKDISLKVSLNRLYVVTPFLYYFLFSPFLFLHSSPILLLPLLFAPFQTLPFLPSPLFQRTQATPKWSRRKAGAMTELSDYAFVSLEMDVDLRSAFHWNTKQIFAYIVAEYVTPKNVRSFLPSFLFFLLSSSSSFVSLFYVHVKFNSTFMSHRFLSFISSHHLF